MNVDIVLGKGESVDVAVKAKTKVLAEEELPVVIGRLVGLVEGVLGSSDSLEGRRGIGKHCKYD